MGLLQAKFCIYFCATKQLKTVSIEQWSLVIASHTDLKKFSWSLVTIQGSKNQNGIFLIVLLYSTIPIQYYEGLLYYKLGEVYLIVICLQYTEKNGKFKYFLMFLQFTWEPVQMFVSCIYISQPREFWTYCISCELWYIFLVNPRMAWFLAIFFLPFSIGHLHFSQCTQYHRQDIIDLKFLLLTFLREGIH